MKVRLLVSRVTNEGAENRGDEINVTADEAESLIAAGQAEMVRRAPPQRAIGHGKPPERG